MNANVLRLVDILIGILLLWCFIGSLFDTDIISFLLIIWISYNIIIIMLYILMIWAILFLSID